MRAEPSAARREAIRAWKEAHPEAVIEYGRRRNAKAPRYFVVSEHAIAAIQHRLPALATVSPVVIAAIVVGWEEWKIVEEAYGRDWARYAAL